ncbi:TPA: hypothetical protein ACHTH4_004811 [Escherichia coli]
MNPFKTLTEIKSAASKAIFLFQTGRIDKDELYVVGVDLTCQFNELVEQQNRDDSEAEDVSNFLYAIKHLSTC